jgi:DNA-binding NtrC family response regulator
MKRKIKVLIAEDNPVEALLITHTLEAEFDHIEFARAECKNTFYDAINNDEFDVILCDHFLNDITSLEALDKVREFDSEVPFIVVTSNKDNELARKAINEGAYDYVLKSDLFRLPTAVKNALDYFSVKRELEVIKEEAKKK